MFSTGVVALGVMGSCYSSNGISQSFVAKERADDFFYII